MTNIDSFIVGAGWRPWAFVKVETDEGVTGWGECSDGRPPHGVVGMLADLAPLLIGQDYITIPSGPGWGTEINETVARAYPWDVSKGGDSKTVPPPKSF